MIMERSLFLLIFLIAFALISMVTIPLLQNKNKYEIFHYKHTYSDGSQNDMICIFDHRTGEYRVEILSKNEDFGFIPFDNLNETI